MPVASATSPHAWPAPARLDSAEAEPHQDLTCGCVCCFAFSCAAFIARSCAACIAPVPPGTVTPWGHFCCCSSVGRRVAGMSSRRTHYSTGSRPSTGVVWMGCCLQKHVVLHGSTAGSATVNMRMARVQTDGVSAQIGAVPAIAARGGPGTLAQAQKCLPWPQQPPTSDPSLETLELRVCISASG